MTRSTWLLRDISTEASAGSYAVGDTLTIGRAPECQIVLDDALASRRHARVTRDGPAALRVEDLASRNGVFVNGVLIREPTALRAGDVLRLGATEFAVENPAEGASTAADVALPTRYKRAAAEILVGSSTMPPSAATPSDIHRVLEKKNRHFQSLYDISLIVQEHSEPDAMLAAALRKLVTALRADQAYLLIAGEDGVLRVRAAESAVPGKAPREFRVSRTLTRHVIDEKCAIIARDLPNDDRFRASQSIILSECQSILAVPIILGNTAKGMVTLYVDDSDRGSSQDDLELLCICASIIGPALRNLELGKEIEETQREVLYTMGAIGETRSRETGNHVKRVAEYSRMLALLAGLDATQAELLKQASPMHDIGKVGIPDRVLNKPGKLDDEEWAVMRTHARLGYEMLNHSSRPVLRAAAIVAHEHHEKWDGSGYPRRLAGEAIHVFGRITALADVFDALGSDRCYKQAWPLGRILDHLRDERGRHFDPRLVDLLLTHLDDFLVVRDRFADPSEDDGGDKTHPGVAR
jgi:HD-GYP domain-containing protein (c-di-GMP phosphodiesterase class II)